MTDRAFDLARFLIVDAARRSTALRQHFITLAHKAGSDAEPPALPAPGCWPVLTANEISLGFAMATNVIRNAGFPAEAAQLSVLSGTHGHA